MTVKELIKALQKFPEELAVVTSGYEGGLSDVQKIIDMEIVHNFHSEWYYGPHEEAQLLDEDELKASHRPVRAVYLGPVLL